MSHFVGPGNRVNVANHTAVHGATVRPQTVRARVHIPTPLVGQLVRQVVETAPTQEDAQRLAELVKEAQEQHLQPEQIDARLRDARPWQLLRTVAKNDEKILAYLMFLLAIYQTYLMLRPQQAEPPAIPEVTVNVTVDENALATEVVRQLEQAGYCLIPEPSLEQP